MTTNDQQPRGVHLVGSVPLGTAEEVFRTASAILGNRLRRIPDGETGKRTNWIGWQFPVLARHPAFETVPPEPDAYSGMPRVKLRSRERAQDITFGPLGYAAAAQASYATFSKLKQEQIIPAHYRFQVSLPTPIAVFTVFVMPEDQAAVEPAYEARLLAELAEIAAVIPHDELAIQWTCPSRWRSGKGSGRHTSATSRPVLSSGSSGSAIESRSTSSSATTLDVR